MKRITHPCHVPLPCASNQKSSWRADEHRKVTSSIFVAHHVSIKPTLPETNSSPLKIDVGRRSFPCGARPMFMGYVSFREGGPSNLRRHDLNKEHPWHALWQLKDIYELPEHREHHLFENSTLAVGESPSHVNYTRHGKKKKLRNRAPSLHILHWLVATCFPMDHKLPSPWPHLLATQMVQPGGCFHPEMMSPRLK